MKRTMVLEILNNSEEASGSRENDFLSWLEKNCCELAWLLQLS